MRVPHMARKERHLGGEVRTTVGRKWVGAAKGVPTGEAGHIIYLPKGNASEDKRKCY